MDVALADVDGDGALDLVAPSGITLRVFFQDAPRTFDDVRTWFLYSMSPESVAVDDLDGDGDLDLVAAIGSGSAGGSLAILVQDAPRSFDPTPIKLGGNPFGSRSVAVEDLDGDGDLDLVSANWESRTLTIFWGGR